MLMSTSFTLGNSLSFSVMLFAHFGQLMPFTRITAVDASIGSLELYEAAVVAPDGCAASAGAGAIARSASPESDEAQPVRPALRAIREAEAKTVGVERRMDISCEWSVVVRISVR